jgi:hypothetical protein
MNTKESAMLKAVAFILATLGATGLLVAAGLAEEPQSPAANACIACPTAGVH